MEHLNAAPQMEHPDLTPAFSSFKLHVFRRFFEGISRFPTAQSQPHLSNHFGEFSLKVVVTIGEVGIQAQQIWAVVELHMLHVDQTVNGVAQFSLEPRLGAAVVQNPGCNKNDVRSTPLYFEYPPLVCCIFQVRLCFNMFRQGIHPSGWDIILKRAEHNPRISSFH